MIGKATSRAAFLFTGGGSLGAVQVGMLKALFGRLARSTRTTKGA
jgi:hypothetical protein